MWAYGVARIRVFSPFDGYDDIVRGRFGRWEV